MSLRSRLAVLLGLLALAGMLALGSLVVAIIAFAPVQTSGTIQSSGQTRSYLLHLPAGHPPRHPSALVISLHAAALWPGTEAALTGWDAVADHDTFLVVYPAGTALDGTTRSHLPSRIWLLRPDTVLALNVQFIADLIDTLAARYPVDRQRVYVSGFSNGGAMAFALACRLPGRIAAVGTVAAAQDLPREWCPATAPMPFINFHGTSDPLVPYHGGRSWASPRPFPSVTAWTEAWARRNGCPATPAIDTVAPDAIRTRYEACPNPAVLYTIAGGGHAWPGGKPLLPWLLGRTTHTVSATTLMWEFFKAHPRPGP